VNRGLQLWVLTVMMIVFESAPLVPVTANVWVAATTESSDRVTVAVEPDVRITLGELSVASSPEYGASRPMRKSAVVRATVPERPFTLVRLMVTWTAVA